MNWKMLVVAVLLICLATSLCLYAYLISENSKNSHAAIRVFYFRGRNYMLPDGVVRMEVGLNWVNNLTMTVIINDDDYSPDDGLTLDIIDIGGGVYSFYADNFTVYGTVINFKDGQPYVAATPSSMPLPSPYHTCTYNGTHYIFDVKLPVQFSSPNKVFVWFVDADAYAVCVGKDKPMPENFNVQLVSVYVEFEV